MEGFFVNIPKLIYSFVGPDCVDAVFARVGSPHHKRRKMKFSFDGILEAEENNIKVPGYGKWLFKMANIAQRVGFYLMIIDASTEFGVNWTSTVYQYAGCRIPGGRWMTCETHSIQMAPTPSPQRFLWGKNLQGEGQLLAVGGTGVTSYSGMNPGIAFTIKTAVWPLAGPPVGTVAAYLIDEHGRTVASTGDIVPDAAGKGTGTTFQRFPNSPFVSTDYQVWCTCSGGWAEVTGSTISITDNPAGGIDAFDLCGHTERIHH